ncbi:relaxosome component, NikC family protein [Pseudomonas fluorescens]|uniref:Relaxosome component, NikC family protein n=1 Tax=Pseudomonas fluorescens TaxID=294 RepID=A0A2T0HMV6_PSEFL|nr:relaxosome component, NikC family protein [Pseudomonas fluorescens]PRW84429.1 relaxosome component, NikC family protein [Pseudomonas fluorescens]
MSLPQELPSERIVVSEVLLKLEPSDLAKLPLACKTCPSAMWQLTGDPKNPKSLTVRNYCSAMHTFTWDSRTQEEILDCDRLYEKEDEELAQVEDPDDVPPFLRQQHSQGEQVLPAPGNSEFDHVELEP